MNNITKTLIVAAVFTFFTLPLRAQGSSSLTAKHQQQINGLVSTFLTAIYQRDKEKTMRAVSSSVKIVYLNQEDIKKKIDQLILNQISALDYLFFVSGHNMFKFMENFENLTWKLSSLPSVPSEIFEDETFSKGTSVKYYFLKVKLDIQEVSSGDGSIIKTITKNAEIDILEENGEYKIFGFII